MKMSDFTSYNDALENATKFELENIAKVSDEYRERFLSFMRYINILYANDPIKIEG